MRMEHEGKRRWLQTDGVTHELHYLEIVSLLSEFTKNWFFGRKVARRAVR